MFIEKYSIGIGDRFCHQAKAQLNALIKAKKDGLNLTPVWNKSNREHTISGTTPLHTRKEADDAVKSCRWNEPYYVDADHINLSNVDKFLDSCDFYTIDVADFVGQAAETNQIDDFVEINSKYVGSLKIAGIGKSLQITKNRIKTIARKYLLAVKEAAKIYRHIESAKGAANFITEISMDETDTPQSPVDMLFILSAISAEGIPADTIAPKFTGRFNKGVDYVGDVQQFTTEFEQDVAVIKFSVEKFHLPAGLKLSVHSGSDKFSIYGPINKTLKKFDAGLHLKTAGTTWLEELIGLAAAGHEALTIAKEIYAVSLTRFDELCAPYATVVDIDKNKLPSSDEVLDWDSSRFVSALRHNPSCKLFNPHFRQLLHVGYKIAAEMGQRYFDAIEKYEAIIAKNVTENIYERHIKAVFSP